MYKGQIMDEYEVLWSRESIYDAADIEDYISGEFGEERAEQFNNDIDLEVGRLGNTHKLYTGTGIYYRGFLVYKKPFSPSIIFYTVDESLKRVYVLRILRHEMDWQTMLRETLFYTF